VLPSGAAWRELDFDRLKRAGRQLGTDVAVITMNLRQRLAAREVGLVAFNTVEQALRQRWLPNPDVEDLRRFEAPRRFKHNSLRRFFGKTNPLRYVFGALVMLVALAVVTAGALVFVPTASISMTASSQTVQMIVPVSIDFRTSAIDIESRVVPGNRVDVVVEDRIGVETTGKRSIPRFRAQGRVTFFNNLSTPYNVPANTVVRTSGTSIPARFVTLQPVEAPAGGRIDAAIEAVDEGNIGNVRPNTINQVEGVPSLAVRVINATGTGGGGDETVRAVTQADIERAKRQLRERLFSEAVEKMKTLPEVSSSGLYVVPETLFIADVQDETADRFVTEQADVVNVSTRIQVAALAVAPADLNTIARAALAKQTPAGFSLLSARAIRGDAAEEDAGVAVRYFLVARGIAGAEIDENAVKRLIAGKTRAEAQTLLLQEFALNSTPRITLEPAWWVEYVDRLPWITLRIKTDVKRE
jgi:Baseplate J-like protein